MKKNHPVSPKWDWRPVALVAIFLFGFAENGTAQSLFGEGSASAFAGRVNTAHTAEYQRVLAEFDAYLARVPADAIAAVERCKFIDEFAYLEDATIETAFEDAEKCEEGLRTGPNSGSGAVKLYLWLSSAWEDSTSEGESLLKESGSWTAKQKAALHEGLSRRYEESDELRAGDHATEAVQLDPESALRIRAAEHYVQIGAKSRAVSTVQAMPKPDWNAFTLGEAVKLLLNLGETTAAKELVEANADVDLPPESRVKLAQSMLDAGESTAGRALADKLLSTETDAERFGWELEQKVFDFQLNYGSAAEAETAYRKLRDKGFSADAFARHRFSLTLKHWRAAWKLEDLLGIAALFAFLGFVCLLPLVVILPIHYRSVVKRLKGFEVAPAVPESPWSLKSTWYAFAVYLLVGSLALYVFSYSDFEAMFGQVFGSPLSFALSDARHLGRTLFWGSALCLVWLLPLLRKAKIPAVLLGTWSVRRSILTGGGLAILLLMANGILTAIFGVFSSSAIGLGTDTIRSMQGVYSVYGFLGLLGCAALIVPIVEEFIFRGVLLRSAARHLSVWAAALVQAVVFVALHESPTAFPFLFAFAIACGLLALRSGGLLAPITLHVVNNAFAVMAVLRLTKSVGG